jgi:hypothetical protein
MIVSPYNWLCFPLAYYVLRIHNVFKHYIMWCAEWIFYNLSSNIDLWAPYWWFLLYLIVLQVRGSIPILWEQIVDLSYKPHLRVISHEQTVKFYSSILPVLKWFGHNLYLYTFLIVFPFPLLRQHNIVERHFHDLSQRYGDVLAVDLTDKVRLLLSTLFQR